MLLLACNESKIINVHNGVLIPIGYVFDGVLIDTSFSDLSTRFKVKQFGGVDVEGCFVIGKAKKNNPYTNMNVKLKNFQCEINGKFNTVNIKGYVINNKTALTGLPIECTNIADCKITSSDTSFIITESVTLEGFSFTTNTNSETVNFSFQNNNKLM
jgi:hypothetical protein